MSPPLDTYAKAQGEVIAIINKALGKLALSLMAPGRAVVPMTGKNVANIIERTRSEYLKGRYHGPCNNHYPQNSVAVLTGLMRFGVCRLPFRDELDARGRVRRLFGRYASVVIFDREAPAQDGPDSIGMSLLDEERLARLRKVNDYTDVAKDTLAERYCTYNVTLRAEPLGEPGRDGAGICGKCLEACPSGALANRWDRHSCLSSKDGRQECLPHLVPGASPGPEAPVRRGGARFRLRQLLARPRPESGALRGLRLRAVRGGLRGPRRPQERG